MQIQLAQILFQIINFGVVVGALTFLLYKPVVKTLQNRSKKIEEGQKAADEVIREKEEIEDMKKSVSNSAKREASEIIAEAREQADAKKKELMAKAKDEVKAFVAEEKVKWESEKASMVKQMEGEFTSAVFQVIDKVLGSNTIDAKTHGKLIDQSIKEVTQAL